jgi:transcriptional regulator with XRE-family HTH domain
LEGRGVAETRAANAPTVLRVVLGKRLAELRENAGLSYEQAARALDVTHATIRRMEKAEVGLKLPYVEKLLGTYGVTDPEEVEGFLVLAREANRRGWWHRYRDVLPEWFSAFVSLEGEARVIRAYEPHYVPGLLQTPDYARAVLRAGSPNASDEMVERALALRLERQALLTRERTPPLLWVVMDETVLRRPIGGPAVMRAQTDRLIEACGMPNVRLQVMPFAAGPHPAMYGPFHIFRFELPELPDIVCVESLVGAVYVDTRDDVSTFLEALDRMCAQAAPAQSTEAVLGRIRKEI